MKLDGRWRTGMGLWLIALVMVLGKVAALTNDTDMAVLQAILKSVKDPTKLQWSGNDACGSTVWPHIQCSGTSVTGLQFQNLGLSGELPSNLNQLANLQAIALQGNSFSGPLPTFNGLSNLQTAYLDGNQFDTIPADFFKGLTKLQLLSLDDNPLNASTGWTIPVDLAASSSLSTLSLTNTSLSGKIPSFLGTMASLQYLRMAYNKLSGSIPTTFQNANLINLQLNNQVGSPPLSGPIDVVGSMQSLRQLWLQVNQFSGTIPPLLGLAVSLQDCRLNDNDLVGVIPSTFVNASSLTYFSVKNNHLVGPVPNIPSITIATNYSFGGTNEFCSNQTGVACPPQVSALLSFLAGVGYASNLVQSWGYNNPCAQWKGITCDAKGDVISINLPNDHLSGYISPNLANLSSLTNLILSDNNLTGTIPSTLASLKSLQKVDFSNNNLYGPVPKFTSTTPITSGNPNINKSPPPSAAPGTPPSTIITPPTSSGGSQPGGNPPVGASGPSTGVVGVGKSSSVSVGAIVGAVLGVIAFLAIGAIVALLIFKKKRQRFLRVQSPNTIVVRPGSDNNDTEVVKITVGNSVVTNGASEAHSRASSGPSDVQVVEAGNLVISIQVLRNVTNNFSEENVLGKGGFGVVYKGELDDGTKIAVKRMEASVVSNKGLSEFQAEIAVLTKVRHRHLVALLGYCVDGNERLLVYEYMPMGTLSQHLFDWGKLGLSPLSWKRRLSIALDVARGMEYLHGLAHKSFIHRDLKPSNILLGDDFRAKVSDFGLVKLAPEGKFSVETRLAGTFGYLAPEYAVTGRVTTKSDVFSFGVVLMELITGRRALDESQPEESMHLVTWFRRMSSNKEAFVKAIDRVLEVTDDSFRSICTVAELAGHCTAREPYQRPDMGHAVNVLSPLVEQWKPTDVEDDGGGIDLDMTLPQALKKWQAFEDSSVSDLDDSKVSIPTRPTGFADSFTSSDGR